MRRTETAEDWERMETHQWGSVGRQGALFLLIIAATASFQAHFAPQTFLTAIPRTWQIGS